MEYFVGKLLTYDVIEYLTCNHLVNTQKVLVDVQNVAGAPTEEEAKRLTLEFFNRFFPGLEEQATMENFGKELDLPQNGYTLKVDKVYVKNWEEALLV